MAEPVTKLPVEPEAKSSAAREDTLMPFESLRREVDRLFEDFGRTGWRFPWRQPTALEMPWPRGAALRIAPAVDMAERDKEYEITAELPGMDEKDIEVKLANGNLVIRGEKKEEKEEREKEYFVSERRYGSFQRAFRMPEGVDADKIEASFSKGVLTVKLPKTEEAKKNEKRIGVKAA